MEMSISNHMKHPDITTLSDEEVAEIANQTEDFSGAELGSLVEEALITSFSQDRYGKISLEDIKTEIQNSVTVASRYSNEIKSLREWAVGSARTANAKSMNLSQNKASKNSRPKASYLKFN